MTKIKLEIMAASAALPLLTSVLLISAFALISPAYADGDSPFDPPHPSAGHSAFSPAGSGGKPSAANLAASKELFGRAVKEADKKNLSAAVEYYTEAINLNPHYGEALGNRGAARFNLKDYGGALSDYEAALKIFPDNKALHDLKVQVEGVMRQNASASAQNEAARRSNLSNQIRAQTMLGGDLADPSTLIMMNAQRRGLIQAPAVDYSDPASIIMMNARKRGLIPANTANP